AGVAADASPAVGDEAPAGLHGDRGHRRSRTGAGAANPARRRPREKERREREDEDQARQDEARAADQGAQPPPDPPGAKDRELPRRGTGKEVAGGDRVLELACREPAAAIDAEAP